MVSDRLRLLCHATGYDLIATVRTTSYVDNTAQTGTYAYRVTAVNALGESEPSTARQVTTGELTKITGTVIGTTGSYKNNSSTMRGAALDGSLSTYFDAAEASGAWVGYDLGTSRLAHVVYVMYAPRKGYPSRMTGGKFQVANSPDFSDAVTIASVTEVPEEGKLTKAVAATTDGTYRYLRYFGPGVHLPKDLPGGDIRIPSNCTVYLAPGAVVRARLVVDHARNVRIVGRGMLDHPLRGIEITFSHNVLVDGITVVNPDHYTIFGGQSDSITVRNLKAFSCKSWTDGIDLMCCSDVSIRNVFLRTSDDCIALYNHRWWYWGGSRNFDISEATLWADVAHPVNIGTHGDDRSDKGEILERVRIHDCDVLHARTDAALKLASGDKNTLRDIHFDNIRMEDMDTTALIGLQVVFGAKYNRAPGNRIENVTFSNISYHGNAESLNPCFFKGYDSLHAISGVTLDNIRINGRPMGKKNMSVGPYASGVSLVDK